MKIPSTNFNRGHDQSAKHLPQATAELGGTLDKLLRMPVGKDKTIGSVFGEAIHAFKKGSSKVYTKQ
jgi:hypothetical protein